MPYIRLKNLSGKYMPVNEFSNGNNMITDKSFVRFLPIKDGMKILDVGCGFGRDLFHISRNWDCELVGIDKYDFRKREDCFKFIRTDSRNLPFADNYFDLAIANSVLTEHTEEDAQKIIYEMKRVAKDVWYTELTEDFETFETIHATPFNKKKLVITGSPRTGTTLLQELLDKQPNIRCLPEGQSLFYIDKPNLIPTTKEIVGIKMPIVDEWWDDYPFWHDSKVIFTSRNPMDTVLSQDKKEIETGNLLSYMIKKVNEEDRIKAGLIRHQEIENMVNKFPNHLRISYEDLVTDPLGSIKKCCEYLNTEFQEFDTSNIFTTSIGNNG